MYTVKCVNGSINRFDLCICSGKPILISHGDGDEKDDSGDDTDGEEKVEDINEMFVDCIGNVQAKLNKNNLKNVKYVHPPSEQDQEFTSRSFDNLLKELRGGGDVTKGKEPTVYPFRKRIMGFIDRRQSKLDGNNKKDDIWMYEPPPGGLTRDIPQNAVPEWGISASKTCLLPNMEYDEKAATGPESIDKLNSEKGNQEDIETKMKNGNIGASDHVKGALLTFSFHVKAVDQIKCYIYYNGQMLRFMASDLRIVLPTLFNMDAFQNDAYLENKKFMQELDSRIKLLDEMLVDREFRSFRKSYM